MFIDELDAIGSKRSAKDQVCLLSAERCMQNLTLGIQHYMKQTLNQLLVELDGFQQSEGVIIIAATNFPESLDKALTRPGRFDRHGECKGSSSAISSADQEKSWSAFRMCEVVSRSSNITWEKYNLMSMLILALSLEDVQG